MPPADPAHAPFDPRAITRPDERYWTYLVIAAALTILGFPFVLLAYWVRFKTLRYDIGDEGVSMRVGWLWRKETYVAYRRIQDIHVTRNLLHRWLDLSRIDVMTASGHGGAELTIEGVRDFDALRDYLYSKMRGARGEADDHPAPDAPADEALSLLREIRDELRRLRPRTDRAP